MKILEIKRAAFGYLPSSCLFRIESLRIDAGARILLSGKNGAGKSTLFRILCGEEKLTEGEMIVKPHLRIIRFRQIAFHTGTVQEIFDELFSEAIEAEKALRDMEKLLETNADMYAMREYEKLWDRFDGLGGYQYLTDRNAFIEAFGLASKLDIPFSQLSGGEQQYVRLAKAIFSACDLLLLDEPLSFLDQEKQTWLMEYLNKVRYAFIIVCHEEKQIRKIVSQTIEISNGMVRQYSGNAQTALEQKEKEEKSVLHHNKDIFKTVENKRQEIVRRKEWVKTAEEKHLHAVVIRRLEREIRALEEKIHPSLYDEIQHVKIAFPFDYDKWNGDELILDLKNAAVCFNSKIIFSGFCLAVHMHEHVLITGANGCGKTTLARLLAGEIEVNQGNLWKAPGLQIGWMRQIMSDAYHRLTVYQYCTEVKGMGEEAFQKTKEIFWKAEEDLEGKRLSMLSGGERKKIEIMALMNESSDLLILDEPNVGLDEYTAGCLLQALNTFPGAVILISHDRHYLEGFHADQVLNMEYFETGINSTL